MRKILYFLSVLLVSMLLSGCYVVKISNIKDNVFVSTSQKLSMEEMENVILDAGKQQNWIMTKAEKGRIDAVLIVRTHTAKVAINYNPDMSYSIYYVSSENLNYDKEFDHIHYNYQKWVDTLNKAIDMNLAAEINNKKRNY